VNGNKYLCFAYQDGEPKLGRIQLGALPHDVAITNITPFKTVVGQGYSLNINVTVANQGGYTETFNATAYANTTIMASQNVTLTAGNSTRVTFTWNTTGFAKGNYTLWAYAEPVQSETFTSDNNLTAGWVIVSIVGDITGPDGLPDGKVDMRDVGNVARAFQSVYNSSDGMYWHQVPCSACPHNPNLDINNDGIIDMKDIATVARQFGEHL
jgi:hypothetical protein